MFVASRRVTNRRTKNWRIILKVFTSNLLEPSMSSVYNPYTYIRRHTQTHNYYITARVPEYKDKTSVLYSSSSSRVKRFFSIRFFRRPFAVDKVAMATKTVYCFPRYSSRKSLFRNLPDSIILYYDSRCWHNTVSVEKYCTSFN